MAWTDIDFNKIVAGAITRGPAEVSFGKYLNEFARALDERYNVTEQTFTNPPIPPGVRFSTGDIRNSGVFIDDYRTMINGYLTLWNSRTWYERASLLDPLNYTDYNLTNTDLETAMGSNAYDLLINNATKSFQELWSADLLNGLYELYKLTEVKQATSTHLIGGVVVYNTPTSYINGQVVQSTGSGNSPSPSGTYSNAFSDYLSDRIIGISGVGTPTQIAIVSIGTTSTGISVSGNGGNFEWDVNWNGRDYLEVSLLSKDLDDNPVNIDMVATNTMLDSNQVTDDFSTGPELKYKYNSNFNEVATSDPQQIIEYSEKSRILDGTKGIIYEYYEYSTPSSLIYPPTYDPQDTTNNEDLYGAKLEPSFEINKSSSYIIDVNNPALEYYIAP
mgnify:FL=1